MPLFDYSFNSTEVKSNRTDYIFSSDNRYYVSLGIHTTEYYEHSDWYSNSINFTSPNLPKTDLSPNGSIPWKPVEWFDKVFRFEPCVFNSSKNLYNSTYNVNMTLVQEVEDFPGKMQVRGMATIVLEDTLIPQGINGTFRTSIMRTFFYEEYLYRTIKIDGYNEYYETKDLVIHLSVPYIGYPESLSFYIPELIFASGDQCIWTYNISSEDRFVRQVPQDIGSWNITVPARDIWYIAFRSTLSKMDILDVYLVDRPEKPKCPPSSSYIPCLDFNLIVVFILSVLIFQK